MSLLLLICSDLVITSVCLWFPGHAWKAVCILLEGSGISCSFPALAVGGGPLACQVEMLNGVGDKVQTHFYVGLSEITKASAFSHNCQQIPAGLFPSISCPGSCRNQHCFLRRGVTPTESLLSQLDEVHFRQEISHIPGHPAHHLVTVTQRDPGPTCHHLFAFLLRLFFTWILQKSH